MRRGSQDENLRRVEQFFDIYNPDMRGLKNLLVSEYRNNQKDWFKHTGNFISDAGIKLLEMLGYPRVWLTDWPMNYIHLYAFQQNMHIREYLLRGMCLNM